MLGRLIQALLLTFYISQVSFAQSSFFPKALGENINTSHPELNPVLSPDGKTLYFIRENHPENNYHGEKAETQDIWFSELKEGGSWGEAKPLSQLNHSHYNAILSISEDGKTYLVNGIFDKKNRWVKRGLSVVSKNGETWSRPEKIKIKKYARKNKGLYSNAYMTPDGNTLFLSFTKKFNGKKNDLFVSHKKDGNKWSKPQKLNKTINTRKYSEEAPFFNPATSKLYFSSNRRADKKNKKDFDIFYSQLQDNTYKNWSDPQPLSDTINTKHWDSYFKTNSKGSWGYWSTSRDSKPAPDIYRIKLFEENPFVEVKGSVLVKGKNEPLSSKYPFLILANGIVVDSAKINPDSATYAIKLPLGQRYEIKANAKSFISDTLIIDVSKTKEHSEFTKDLYVLPVPFALVKGRALVRPNDTPIPMSAGPTMAIDGRDVDSIHFDDNGAFELHLKFGKVYDIKVKANKYVAEEQKVDLRGKDEYQEILMNLYVQKYIAPAPDVAIITGKIYDKKTNKPMSPDVKYQIQVNDNAATEVNVNTATAEYKLQVPLGKMYTINASAPNYYPVYEMIDLTNEKGSIKVIKDLSIAPIEVGVSIKLNNIFFATGKSDLKPESFPELDRVGKFLNENPTIKIEIAGHTDNVGKAQSNLILSQNRANSVMKYIQSKGIAADRIVAKGYGMNKPVAPNTTKQGKALNRRVEFTILEK